jgi:hypothetical protein
LTIRVRNGATGGVSPRQRTGSAADAELGFAGLVLEKTVL